MKLFFPVVGLYALAGVGAGQAAPTQLYNKTISIGWTAQSTQRDPDGNEKQVSSSIHYVVYVSTAGRLFERASRSAGARTQAGENDPGATQSKIGEARGLRFEGNTLVANRAYVSGAMRAMVTFDSSYSNCSVAVTHGKGAGGAIKRKGIDGVVREYLSIAVTSTSCSIGNGNAFANK